MASIISISRCSPCCKLQRCRAAQGEHHQHQPLWLLQAAKVQGCAGRASSASAALPVAASCKGLGLCRAIISISRSGRCYKLQMWSPRSEHHQHQPLCALLQAAAVQPPRPRRAWSASAAQSVAASCKSAGLGTASIISISRSGCCCKLQVCMDAQDEHHQHEKLWPLLQGTDVQGCCAGCCCKPMRRAAQGEHHQHQLPWMFLQGKWAVPPGEHRQYQPF